MEKTARIDVARVIDEAKISRFQWLVYVLLFIVIAMDGYDTQSIAFVAPVIAKKWHITPAAFGFIFSAGLFGILVGAFLFGRLADWLAGEPW